MFIVQHMHPLAVSAASFLSIEAEQHAELVIKVLNNRGQMAKKIKTPVQQGKQTVALNMSDLETGNYVLNAFYGDVFVKAIRFVKN
jgi:hypothetical protein